MNHSFDALLIGQAKQARQARGRLTAAGWAVALIVLGASIVGVGGDEAIHCITTANTRPANGRLHAS